jgi:hypothetical protein
MKTSINIATYPARFESLLKTLDTLKGQADIIRIYLNEYTEVPNELKDYYCVLGDNLTDNGKFFWLDKAEDEYYFTCDDDILYPPTYVSDTITRMGTHPIVTYHGRVIHKPNQNYYGGYRCFNCFHTMIKDQRIDVGGTGVMCIDTRKFKATVWNSKDLKMSDCILSLEAAKQKVPITILAHKSGYLGYIPQPQGATIFDTSHKDCKRQTEIATEIYYLKTS